LMIFPPRLGWRRARQQRQRRGRRPREAAAVPMSGTATLTRCLDNRPRTSFSVVDFVRRPVLGLAGRRPCPKDQIFHRCEFF
jgi:hypothetical protein